MAASGDHPVCLSSRSRRAVRTAVPFTPLPSDIAAVVAIAPDIDSYLSRRETAHAGVKPGLAKTVIWNDPAARHKTPLSLVYIHGFSARLSTTGAISFRLAENPWI